MNYRKCFLNLLLGFSFGIDQRKWQAEAPI